MADGGSRKVTYSLPEELLSAMEGAVREGAAPSYSAFVAEAVRERLERLREERLREAFAEAARDPLFLEDVEETMGAFAEADRAAGQEEGA
ncbi:MAG: CopG family transcriptional regulator [Acidobacteria bacterium]|nr:CopG family transcriptional regulator [Acidobacteriota bacterium]